MSQCSQTSVPSFGVMKELKFEVNDVEVLQAWGRTGRGSSLSGQEN